MSADLLTALAASAITMAVPLLFAALGELIAERSGVLNIGLEGMMLTGAFAALAVSLLSGSVALGVGIAVLTGAGLGAVLAWFVVALNANQVVAGTALNLLAAGLTGVAYRAVFGVTGAALTISGAAAAPIPGLAEVPVLGPFFDQNLLGYAAFLLAPVIGFALWRTLPGLQLRMVGENPYAAETQGVAVRSVRTAALIGCGALAAAGGAYLSVAYANTFVEGMSAGRGFIALAIVIVGRRTASGTVLAALFFGFATALQFHFQALGLHVPFQFFLVLPYALTLLVLAGFAGRVGAPAALGQPYER
ncbi:MAG: ABC transporter permease [Deltaproteobacteria bacterium]|nr:ABC transporter permease [Deltaproteobacteria bacterium]